MAGQKKTREKIMKEHLDGGGSPAQAVPYRAMPPLDITAHEVKNLDAEEVMNAIIDGYSLRDIAAKLDENHIAATGKPRSRAGKLTRTHASGVLRWMEEDETRVRAYELAREMAAEAMMSELRQLSAEPVPLTIFGQYDSGAVQDKRTRINALQWIIAKFKPRAYGEKLDLTSGNKPLPQMSEAQADARLVALLAKLKMNAPKEEPGE
jgi:hypothetical protein